MSNSNQVKMLAAAFMGILMASVGWLLGANQAEMLILYLMVFIWMTS